MIETLLFVFVPPIVFAIILAWICDMSINVFLSVFALGICIVIGAGNLDTSYIVFPAIIMAVLIWKLAFGFGGGKE